MSKNLRNQVELSVNSISINSITITSPQNVSYVFTLPPNTGTSGQVLTTDGNGTTTWTSAAVLPGAGTVTAVSATAPSFLTATVTNPTSTPNVALTLSGTPLPVANGGTGSSTRTGIGIPVFATSPILISPNIGAATGTSLNLSGLTASRAVATDISKNLVSVTTTGTGSYVLATSPSLVTPALGVASATSLTTSGTVYSTGTLTTNSNLVVQTTAAIFGNTSCNANLSVLGTTTLSNPLPVGSGGTGLTTAGSAGQILGITAGVPAWITGGSGSVTSVAASVPAFLSVSGSPITTSGTLAISLSGTALPTANGGTGLTTVGTSGQYLSSNGSTLSWVAPSAGTGSVISVSLAVDSSLSGLFTNTGTGTVTTSGTFTLSQAANPTITLGSANYLTVTTSATGDSSPLLLLSPSMGNNTTNRFWVGKASNFTGGGGYFQYGRGTSDTDTTNYLAIGIGATSSLKMANNGANTITGSMAISAAATVGTTLGVTGALTAASASLTAPLPVASGGTGLSTSGSAGQVLGITAGVPAWVTPGVGGTVTSVAASVPAFLSVSGSPITTSGTLAISLSGTALPTANGGTGLTTVGTSGQYLSSNGSTLSWVNPTIPGTGTVTSVDMTVPSFLSVVGNPITTSGTLALAYSGSALPVINGGTGSTTASTGTGGVVLENTPTLVTPVLGVATATSLVTNGVVQVGSTANDLTLAISSLNSSTVVDIEAYRTSASGTKRTIALNQYGGGVTIGTGGLTIGAPLPVGSGGTGSTSASTGTGGVVLAVSPTFTSATNSIAPLYSSNTAASGATHVAEFYAPNLTVGAETHFQVGKSNATNECVNLLYRHTATDATKRCTLRFNTSEFTMYGDVTVASTLNTPLTITGPLVSTTLNATDLTPSYAVATDGSKNLVSVLNTGTGSNVLAVSPTLQGTILLTSTSTYPQLNHTGISSTTAALYGYETGKDVYWGENADTGVYYFRGRTMNTGGITVTGGISATGNITASTLLYANSYAPISGSLSTFTGSIAATPRFANRTLSSKLINGLTDTVITGWTNVNSSILTETTTRYTNSTGATVYIYVSFSIVWDPLFGGGDVKGCILSDLGRFFSYHTLISSSNLTTTANSGIMVLPNGSWIEAETTNYTPTNLTISNCTMSYYVLN